MATTAKKLAKRILRRINGVLTVVYVDVETGAVLNNLDGYTLISHDGQSGGEDGKKEDAPKTETDDGIVRRTQGKRSSDATGDPYEGHPEYRSVGSGDIIGDIGKGVQELNRRITETRDNIGSAIKGTAMRIGAAILPDSMKNEIASQATDQIKDSVGNAISGVGDWIFGGNGNGGGSTASAPAGRLTSPNEMFTYRDISIRNEPLHEDYFTNMAAAAASVDPNIRFEISSAGQTSDRGPDSVKGRDWTGSHRHDVDEQGFGHTADLMVYLNGEQQTPNNNPQLFESLVTAAATVGFTGIGVSPYSNFIHVGGGDPAVWTYNRDGASAPAPSNLQRAYTAGVEANRAGEGERLIQSYVEQISQPQPETPPRPPVDVSGTQMSYAGMEGVTPALAQAVTGYRESRGEPIIPPVSAAIPPLNMSTPLVGPLADTPIGQSQVPEGFNYSLPAYEPTQREPITANQAIEQAAPRVASRAATAGFMNSAMPYAPTAQEVAPAQTAPAQSGRERLDALLDVINYAEGSPGANTLFGYGDFDDFSTHPNERVYYNNGKDFSTAAGLYQINNPTYQDYSARLGITGFGEQEQRALASEIARDRYSQNTGGRDLLADLSSNDPNSLERVFDALSGTWSSLPSGSQSRTRYDELRQLYDESLSRYSTPSTPTAPEPTTPSSSSTFMDSRPSGRASTAASTPTSSSSGSSRAASQRSGARSSESSSSSSSSSPTRVGTNAVSRDAHETRTSGRSTGASGLGSSSSSGSSNTRVGTSALSRDSVASAAAGASSSFASRPSSSSSSSSSSGGFASRPSSSGYTSNSSSSSIPSTERGRFGGATE